MFLPDPSPPCDRPTFDRHWKSNLRSEPQATLTLLSAETLFHYQRCARRAFLNTYGDTEQQDRTTDFLQKLLQDSAHHRQRVLSHLHCSQPQSAARDWQTRAEATLALMQAGAECICHGVLMAEEGGLALTSTPDLLVRYPGKSDFGNWTYIPADIKLGKRPKSEYQITAAFHVYVLERIQGVRSQTAWLWLRRRGNPQRLPHPWVVGANQISHLFDRLPDLTCYAVGLDRVMPQLLDQLNECAEMLRSRQEPEVFISRYPCSLCHWYSSCYATAVASRHLSLIPGVTPTRYRLLQEAQMTTLEALAQVRSPELAEILLPSCNDNPRVALEAAVTIVRQAQASYYQRAIAIPDPPHMFLEQRLPTAPVEMYFDVEAEPDLDVIFLHGLLVVDRQQQTSQFYSLLAERPDAEGEAWEQFVEVVNAYPDAPIFHFCEYEMQIIKKLAKRYKTPRMRWQPLLQRMVDIHQWVTKTVVLPTENYALKSIARWMGFEWRGQQVNGAQCVSWYNQWLREGGDRTCLEAIVQYNEDDCRATYVVKDWLAEFLSR